MGEAKRRKKQNPQGFGTKIRHSDDIELGAFMESSEVTSVSPETLKNSGVIDSGRCIPFWIRSVGLMGLAYPCLIRGSTDIHVGIVWMKTSKSRLSDAEAEKKSLLFRKAVAAKVAKTYKADIGEIVATLF